MKTLLLSTILLFTVSLNAQDVNVPDTNFKSYLVNNTLINTNGDSEIQISEASAFTGGIFCYELSISDLTGIEAFTALVSLWCQNNQLTSLDVSSNTALTYLYCGYNQLTSLDVSSNTALTELECWANQLTSLDVSSNTDLTKLWCYANQLECLNVKNGNNIDLIDFWASLNPNLTCIEVDDVNYSTANWTNINPQATFSEDCNNGCSPPPIVNIPDANFKAYLVGNTNINTNGDTEIQVSEASAFTGEINCGWQNISDLSGIEAFTSLTQLFCFSNQLTSLDVSSNTALTNLQCPSNQLTSLDVSGATALITLACYNNQLTSLDVSNNTALITLSCQNNQLECLNVKNGNNTLVGGDEFYAYNNPSLTCIEVDDVNYSTVNWTAIDNQISFSTDCNNDCSACTPTSSIDSHTVCDNYTWVDGNTYTSSNNTAQWTEMNAAGCDSIITLDLTITPFSTSSLIETACSFYVAPDDEVYTSSGSYTATIDNTAGCDSVIYIDLTIDPLPNNEVTQNGLALIANQTSASYQWLDCDNSNTPIEGEENQTYFPSTTGNYTVIVTVNGCSNTSECILVDFTRVIELNKIPKQLVKILDVLGRETPFKPSIPLLYIYDDGTVERKVVLK